MQTLSLLRAVFLSLLVLLSARAFAQGILPADASGSRTIVITIDDLPGAVAGSDSAPGNLAVLSTWNKEIILSLRKHHVPAIGFVNEGRVKVAGEDSRRAALLKAWLEAGFELGNHTYSHIPMSSVTLDAFEVDVLRGQTVVNAILREDGKQERFFRHPALDQGRTDERLPFANFLTAHQYRIAPVTVENADWKFNDALFLSEQRKEEPEQALTLGRAYLFFTNEMLAYAEQSSLQLFGRFVPQFLLIHDSDLNARYLEPLLSQLEAQGYRFITIDQALSDPAYRLAEPGVPSLERCYLCWRAATQSFGRSPVLTYPHPPVWVSQASQELRSIAK